MTQPTPGEVADQIERTGSRVELEYLAGAHRALILRALRALDAEPSDAAVEPDARYRLLAHAYCRAVGIKPDEPISDAGHEAWELVADEAVRGVAHKPSDAEVERAAEAVADATDCAGECGTTSRLICGCRDIARAALAARDGAGEG